MMLSRKTFAYLLPILQSRAALSVNDDDDDNSELYKRTAVIVSPTRELAVQLASDAQSLLPEGSHVALAIDKQHLPTFDEVSFPFFPSLPLSLSPTSFFPYVWGC
jgi:hypothetical protein